MYNNVHGIVTISWSGLVCNLFAVFGPTEAKTSKNFLPGSGLPNSGRYQGGDALVTATTAASKLDKHFDLHR